MSGTEGKNVYVLKGKAASKVPLTDLYAILPGSLILNKKTTDRLAAAIRKTPRNRSLKLSPALARTIQDHYTRFGDPVDKQTWSDIHNNNDKKHHGRRRRAGGGQ
tara:strand:- start:2109 stop:2423 length:315 start_codon:yes stop_codon:yes gene_type:complete